MREPLALVVDAYETGFISLGECAGKLIERCVNADDARSLLSGLSIELREALCKEARGMAAAGAAGKSILRVSNANGTRDVTERMLAGAQLVLEASKGP